MIEWGARGGHGTPSDPHTPQLNSLKRGKIKCVTELQIQHSPLHPHSFRTPPPPQHTLTHNYLGTIGKLCHHGNGLWGSGQEQLLHQINSDSDNPSSFLTIHTHCTTSTPPPPSLKFACCSPSLSPSLVCPSCPPPSPPLSSPVTPSLPAARRTGKVLAHWICVESDRNDRYGGSTVASLTFPNWSKYCFTSSMVVFTERPPTKIFLVRVTSWRRKDKVN